MSFIPRSARLDAPGVLHHVMGRGIEKRPIFLTDEDRNGFLSRLGLLAEEGCLKVYAWALIPNHYISFVKQERYLWHEA